ncbi:MAG: hypothetical protein KBA33_00100 [Cloacibacterium sp.]|nr:hypothetical protein [Cloacibacterium sp.]
MKKSTAKELHVVSFDYPYPPNYGGIIDVFFKIKALHQLGYHIYLHCFVKKIPKNTNALQGITSDIFFYKTQFKPSHFMSSLPFSVEARNDKKLLHNLTKNKAPILFEAMKTTKVILEESLKNRIKIVRMHNIESNYYLGLSKSEKSFYKKKIYQAEAKKYLNYEKQVTLACNAALTLSHNETEFFEKINPETHYIPVFHGNRESKNLNGFGKFVLYHGDLTISDNRKCVAFLVSVFKKIPDYSLVISSGSCPSFIKKVIKPYSNISFKFIDGFQQLKELMEEAHICISWSFQKSGTKLKLINSLYCSRHCIINENIVDDKDLQSLCCLTTDETSLTEAIKDLMKKPFADHDKRKKIIDEKLNDFNNAEKIDNLLAYLKEKFPS